MELKAGTIDGAIIDNAVAMYYLKQGADKDLKLVGEPTKAEGTVLGMKKATKLYKKLLIKLLKNLKKTALTKKSTTNGSAITTKNNIYLYKLG